MELIAISTEKPALGETQAQEGPMTDAYDQWWEWTEKPLDSHLTDQRPDGSLRYSCTGIRWHDYLCGYSR